MIPAGKKLLRLLYSNRAYVEAARAVGYEGCTLAEFWERVKPLGIEQGDMLAAVYDITRGDKREQSRYELRDDVKELSWQLLGFPPGHPLRDEMEPPEAETPAEGFAGKEGKKSKKPRGKAR